MNQYDSIIKYIPSLDSPDIQWIAWHKMLSKGYGLERANSAFIVAFAYLAGSGAKTNRLKDYCATQGLKIDVNLLRDAGRIIGNAEESIGGVFHRIGGIFRTSRTIIIILIILILIPVFMLLFNVARDPAKSIGAAAKIYGKIQTGGLL